MTREQEAPTLIGVGVQALVENADRLGLTWQLRPATVNTVSSDGSVTATYDGDTVPIGMISMIGTPVIGSRVMATFVPPAGNFIVGNLTATIGPVNALYSSISDADLTLTTALQAVSGTLIPVTVQGNARWEAEAVFGFEETVAGVTLGIGALEVDAVAQTGQALFKMATVNDEVTAAQIWTGTLTSGSHTFELSARKNIAAGTQIVLTGQTKLKVKTYE